MKKEIVLIPWLLRFWIESYRNCLLFTAGGFSLTKNHKFKLPQSKSWCYFTPLKWLIQSVILRLNGNETEIIEWKLTKLTTLQKYELIVCVCVKINLRGCLQIISKFVVSLGGNYLIVWTWIVHEDIFSFNKHLSSFREWWLFFSTNEMQIHR